MLFYHVKNWEKFQHYKDRNPPWVKLHFELLSSADWVILDDASRVLAVACMLIASRNEGNVPADPHYMRRVAYLNSLPKFKPLIDCGFLEIPQALASTLQADARPETETYSKDRKESKTDYASEFENWWKEYPSKAGSKFKSSQSYTKAILAGVSHEELLTALQRFKAHHKALGTESRYIPHATTYLNGKQWENSYETPKVPHNTLKSRLPSQTNILDELKAKI